MEANISSKNYYDILGLGPDTSQDAIRSAYKQLALQWHPDRNQNNQEHAQQRFIEIREAYLALTQEHEQCARASGGKPSKAKHTAAPLPTFSPKSTPSECENPRKVPTSHAKSHSKANHHPPRRSRDHTVPYSPAASSSSSSLSSQSGLDAAYFEHHLSYMKVEHTAFAEQEPFNSRLRDHKCKKASSEDDSYEFIDPVDLESPLIPLRMPKNDIAKDWVFPLPLTLDDLYHSASQHYRITRTLNSGKTQNVKVDIRASPILRTGMRMRIPSAGNQRRDGSYQDIVFVVKEIPHPRFTRIGDDLHLSVHVPWANASTSPYTSAPSTSSTGQNSLQDQEVYIRTLNGEEFALPIPRTLVEGADGTRIVGGGMPLHKDGKNIGKGDLIVKWIFTFSDSDKIQRSSPWTSFRKAMVWKS